MSSPVLIVGLGNPGREYASTRHNVGWLLLDELVRAAPAMSGFKKKFQGEYAKGTLADRECIFLRPETFMNDSGRSVQGAAAFFHASGSDIVVLHDELDLPFGEVRVKVAGGHAGHNGLRSLVQHLGSADFVRVRMGIGRPPPGFSGEVADYVLSAFDPVERARLPEMIDKAAKAVIKILVEGPTRAMNEANTRPKSTPPGAGAPPDSGARGQGGAGRPGSGGQADGGRGGALTAGAELRIDEVGITAPAH
jgi:PTH1 family peptidyl-tRNA hydrolase